MVPEFEYQARMTCGFACHLAWLFITQISTSKYEGEEYKCKHIINILWYIHYSVQSLYAPLPFTKKYIVSPPEGQFLLDFL